MNITRRVKIEGKGYRFCPVVFSANGRVKPNVVLVDGKETVIPDGRFYVDFTVDGQRRREPAGETAAEAQSFAERKAKELAAFRLAKEAGLDIAPPTPFTSASNPNSNGKSNAKGKPLKEAVDIYLKGVQRDKKPRTHLVYDTTLRFFQESCTKAILEEIDRDDLLDFRAFLQNEKGCSRRTADNYLNNVVSFLNAQGIPRLLKKGDRKKPKADDPEIYERKELGKFFAACDPYERLLFEFFLWTGCREQEVIYLRWQCVNFDKNVIEIKENPEYQWTPKTVQLHCFF